MTASFNDDDVRLWSHPDLSATAGVTVTGRDPGNVRSVAVGVSFRALTAVDRGRVAFIAKREARRSLAGLRLVPDVLDTRRAVGVLEVRVVIVDSAVHHADDHMIALQRKPCVIVLQPRLIGADLRDTLVETRVH